MITELATFDIIEGKQSAFEADFKAKALDIISRAEGFIEADIQQCIETPTKYLLHVKWRTLLDHTKGFRQSDLFKDWRAVLSPYFNTAPVAEHYVKIS